mgnify:CR=1 FL=1
MKLPEQVTRLGVVILVVVASVLLLRFVVLPATLFSARPHQEAKVVREMAKPMHYAGMTTCRECHADEYDTKLKAQHRTIGCENCHGPALVHVADKTDKSAIPPKHREREFCLGGYEYNAGDAVNFAIGLFSPAIHTLRLHYVEFFGKFYSPGGRRYEPFGHWNLSAGR